MPSAGLRLVFSDGELCKVTKEPRKSVIDFEVLTTLSYFYVMEPLLSHFQVMRKIYNIQFVLLSSLKLYFRAVIHQMKSELFCIKR